MQLKSAMTDTGSLEEKNMVSVSSDISVFMSALKMSIFSSYYRSNGTTELTETDLHFN